MDTARAFDEERIDTVEDDVDSGVGEAQLELTGSERRMHVRAYNYWVSLLRGRAYPSIEDLDSGSIADFGMHSVLLDFTGAADNPAIRFLGRALREECALDSSITHIAQVPSRSLLSRLTDHYLQIIANRAPIGFEAEFLGTRGNAMFYRGILMPFSSDSDTIDYIYGIINWKERVDAETQAKLDAEVAESRRTAPEPKVTAPVWADGPGHEIAEDAAPLPVAIEAVPESLADCLMLAQRTAASVRTADTRSRAALYHALGRAHDFAEAALADPDAYADLLAEAGLTPQARAPLTPVTKLVFGVDYDKTRLTEFAAVLSHARRNAVPSGGLGAFLEGFEGGIKAVVKAERMLRRPAPATPRAPQDALAGRAAIATLELDTGAHDGALVLLVARAHGDALDIIASVANDAALTARAVRAVR